jgi:deferrochelatase/peroxidase EfeB
LVLVADPYAAPRQDCFGSYLVFRKLEQNVRGFREREELLARWLGLKGSAVQRAGALIIGRFRDGTPVTASAAAAASPGVPNNFNYAEDADGTRCPFRAHIRKMNPRGDGARLRTDSRVAYADGSLQDQEWRRRIVRRGIPYGVRQIDPRENPRTEQLPTRDVGLLFLCFQSSLANQFGFLQKLWANAPDFARENTGIDPLVGQHADHLCPIPQRWPLKWGKAAMTPFAVGGFVSMKGGEFLFAPSIPFLTNLQR